MNRPVNPGVDENNWIAKSGSSWSTLSTSPVNKGLHFSNTAYIIDPEKMLESTMSAVGKNATKFAL